LIVISFKLDEKLLDEIETLAKLEGKTRSQVIREALQHYLLIKRKVLELEPKMVKLPS